ncbi:MAG: thermonuclease family protein [Patescibacteria group bacterium]
MTRTNKKLLIYILAIIYASLQLIFGKTHSLSKIPIIPTNIPVPTSFVGEKQTVKVVRVIDGDTIEIEGKIKVRYVGINTPEIYHDTTGKKTGEQCFADESYLENKKLVEGKIITLVKDVSDKDKYGRLLRYVYVDPSTSSGQAIFVNDYLITNGFAKIMTIKPDIKYAQQFKEDEKAAKTNNLGIWKTCH